MATKMTRFREIESKFNSTCGGCGAPIAKGDGVWWKKGERVRCGDCTPREDRALFGDLDAQRRAAARKRASLYLNERVLPFVRRDPTGAAAPLIEQLKKAYTADEINALVDRLDEMTEPVRGWKDARSGLGWDDVV
jgi:hypothetical protein